MPNQLENNPLLWVDPYPPSLKEEPAFSTCVVDGYKYQTNKKLETFCAGKVEAKENNAMMPIETAPIAPQVKNKAVTANKTRVAMVGGILDVNVTVEKIKKLSFDGNSTREIARVLGAGYSHMTVARILAGQRSLKI